MAIFGDNQCWSWVHFNHSNSIQSDYNVSSVSHIGTGQYAVYIDSNAPTSNYCILAGSQWDSSFGDGTALSGSYVNATHSTSRYDVSNKNPANNGNFNNSAGLFSAIFSTY